MKTIRHMSRIILPAVILMTGGCMAARSVQKWPESAPVSGAAAMLGKADRKNSPYYPHHDFFKGGITPTLKLIKGFRTCQQTTECTCGAASLRMVLDHWGMADKSERALAEEAEETVELEFLRHEKGDAARLTQLFGILAGKMKTEIIFKYGELSC